MRDKPPSNDPLTRYTMPLAAFACLFGVVVIPLVPTEDMAMTDVALCMVVPFTLAHFVSGHASSLGWLSVIQVVGLAGTEVTIYMVSARRRRKWPVRLLLMVIAWVLVTTITNISLILSSPIVSA